MHKRGSVVPAATAALLLLYGFGRSLVPGAIVRAWPPRDRNPRRAIAGVVEPLATPMPRAGQSGLAAALPGCGSGVIAGRAVVLEINRAGEESSTALELGGQLQLSKGGSHAF